MKILHVISSLDKRGGGTSEVVPRICRAMHDGGAEVQILVCYHEKSEISIEAEKAIACGVGYECVERIRRPRILWLLGYSPRFRMDARKWVAWADIVYIHGLWMAPGWIVAQEACRISKPYVVMPHGFLDPERLKISKWKKRLSTWLFDRKMLTRASAIIATSEYEANGIRAFGLCNRIHIVPLGIDIESFEVRGKTRDVFSLRTRTLLYFSRITPIKGLDMLASVWEKLYQHFPDWRLRIVGPDDRGYSKVVKKMFADNCPSGCYSIEGPVFGEDKFDVYKCADAFILPTRSENWSVAVAEAMASALPVVCTKGAPWGCLNEVNAGAWVDISKDAIYKGLEIVMGASDEERSAMGERGREWVKTNLGWQAISDKLCKII